MFRATLLLLCFALPVGAADRDVTLRFLGGVKQVPLAELQVTIRRHTGDWSVDHLRSLTTGATDQEGRARFRLAEGWYYVDIAAERELPYLDRPVGFKSPPNLYSRMIQVGQEQSFEFNLADACRLTLRAVDVDTGRGLAGAEFVTENVLAEDWAHSIDGDNLGPKSRNGGENRVRSQTDADGNFTRLIGPRHGYTYYVWLPPPGYEPAAPYEEVTLESPVGTPQVNHVFKFRRKK